MNAPTAVVFDVGNVLYHWDPRNLYRRMIGDEAALEAFIADTDFVAWHFELDGGRVFAEAAADLGSRFPHHKPLIDAWGPRFGESIGGPVAGMREIVERLDAGGVPLFAITNFSAEFWGPFAAREASLFDRFRGIVVSGEERMVKPDPAIYALALDRFGLAGPDALFVDDRTDNVAGAIEAGMRSHLFTDAAGLRERLAADGLPH